MTARRFGRQEIDTLMQSEQRVPTASRKALLWLGTALVPIPLFVLCELMLRLVGFGGSYPLFVDAIDDPGYRHANPEVIQRYFSEAPELAIDTIYFRQQKSADAYRIVVQGGSTAAGFPYGRWGGLAGMLGTQLESSFPNREIEVISTALAAVNSYTMLDFVDEILEIEPDAVLIYAGHNEYLGIFGVGSALTGSQSRRATQLHLALRTLRVYQAVRWLVSFGRRLLPSDEGNAPAGRGSGRGTGRGTLMAQAAASSRIPFDSDAYQRGVAQLEANFGAILAKYQRAGVPVYIGTLASNEKGQRPFSSGTEPGGDDADSWYSLGEQELAAGRTDSAREAFRTAIDRDQLRFRAPSEFNQAIRRLARRYEATLVDVQAQLARASASGIIGDELLLEHVHPNPEGYFLLANAYYEALKHNGAIEGWPDATDLARARRDLPVTEVDRILADHAVAQLEADFPFTDTPRAIAFPTPTNEVERVAWQRHAGKLDWIGGMEALLQHYRRTRQIDRACTIARMAAQALPTLGAPNYSAGMLFKQAGRFALARRYLERSLRIDPKSVETLQALVRVNQALGDREQAGRRLAELEQIAPFHPFVGRKNDRRLRNPQL